MNLLSASRSGLGLLLACLAACGGETSCCTNPPPAATGAPSDHSVHLLEHRFVTQTGESRTLADFRGQPVLIALVFTHCSFACPALVADVQHTLTLAGSPTSARVVLVSMDHERDTPPVLAEFAAKHRLAGPQWTLLHGDAAAVAELAAVLGVRYAKVDGGDYSHSNRICLLDGNGEIVHRHDGLGTAPAELAAALQKLASATH